jgi:hypothetical protein
MKTTVQYINSLIVTGVAFYLSSCVPSVNYEYLLDQVYIPSNEEKGEIFREDLAVYGDVYLCVFKVGNPYNATDDYLVSYNKKGKLIDGMNLGFGYDFSQEEDPEVLQVDYRLVSDRVVRVWNKITVGEHFKRTEENRIFIDASGKFHVRATEVSEKGNIDDLYECQNRFLWKMYELSRIPLSDSTVFDQWNHLGDAEGVFADDLSIAIHSLYLRNPESYFKWMLRARERDSLTAFLVPEDSLLQRDILNRASAIKDKESREYILNKLRKEIMMYHNGEQ